jgi:prepilin-type N-terminal cleavage/methylation domain-containing protein
MKVTAQDSLQRGLASEETEHTPVLGTRRGRLTLLQQRTNVTSFISTVRQPFKEPPRFKSGKRDAFTLIELLVATALLGLLAGSAIWGLTLANNYASIARLYTGAETAAQNQIDLILTESPFNPQANPPQVPIPLTLGTSAAQTVTIYSEPAGAGGQTHTVTGQMVTTVASNNVVTQGQNLNLYSATVVVTYTYRSKVYRVQLNAMRASDV